MPHTRLALDGLRTQRAGTAPYVTMSSAQHTLAPLLRLLTWNVWGRFEDWEARQPGIQATLAALDPHVIALQETWPEQAAKFAAILGRHVVSTIHPASNLFGLAILSRDEIVGNAVADLPSGDAQDEHRQVLRADLDTAAGPISVTTTHLNYRLDHSAVRQEQVRTVLDLVRSAPTGALPPLLCGDFNAVPDADEIRILTGRAAPALPGLVFHDAWEAGHGDGFTWSRDNPEAARHWLPEARIDYVFVGYQPRRPGRVRHVEVVAGERSDGLWPSDHFALFADIDLSRYSA